MLVKRINGQRLLFATILSASLGYTGAASAQDTSSGWSSPAQEPATASPPVAAGAPPSPQAHKTVDDKSAPSWTDKSDATSATPKETQGTGVAPFAVADTALSAGDFEQALRSLTDEWARILPSHPDALTTARFFERKAIAHRGLQQLAEAERALKQALGHATIASKDSALQGRLLFQIADILSQEGLPRDAVDTAKQTLAALKADQSAEARVLEAETHNTYGRALTDVGNIKLAEEELGIALKAAQALPGGENQSSSPPKSAVSRFSDFLIAKIKINSYLLEMARGKDSVATRLYDQGLTGIKSYAPGITHDTRYNDLVLSAHRSIEERGAEAPTSPIESMINDADKIQKSDNLIKAALAYELASAYLLKGDSRTAAELTKTSNAIRLKALPANSVYNAEILLQMSDISIQQGKSADAAAYAQRAYAILERSTGRNSLPFAKASASLAAVYMTNNKFDQVEPLLLEAVRVQSTMRGNGHPETLKALDLMSTATLRNKKYKLAADYALIALTNGEREYGTGSPKIVQSLICLGTANSHLKNYTDGTRYLLRAQSILMRGGKTKSAEYADVLASLGVSYTLQKKWATAADSLKQAKSIYTTIYGADSTHVAKMASLLRTMENLKNPRVTGVNVLMQNNWKPTSPQFR